MSDGFDDLPKFPTEASEERARLLDHLRHGGPPADTWQDRLRHALPAVVLVSGVALGLLLVAGMALVLGFRPLTPEARRVVVLGGVILALTAVAVGAAVFQRKRRNKSG